MAESITVKEITLENNGQTATITVDSDGKVHIQTHTGSNGPCEISESLKIS